jgi:transcriptional regulator with XRE-family HTH domain
MAPDHSTEHDALGHVVRVVRGERGLSQEELGYRAGLHRNYIGAIERGEINPTFRVLLKLERGLQVPLSDLMHRTETYAHADPRFPRDPNPKGPSWRSQSPSARVSTTASAPSSKR